MMYEQAFEVDVGAELRAEIGDMDIQIERASGSVAEIEVWMEAADEVWGRELFRRMNFRITRAGGGLRIESNEARVSGSEWRQHGHTGFLLLVHAPANMDMVIETRDGDIAIEEARGRLDVETSDGDVVIGSASGPGIRLRSSDGDIVARALEGTMDLSTSDGDVLVDSFRGELRARTSDGDLFVRIDRLEGLDMESGDGDITIVADPDLAAEVSFRAEDLYIPEAFTLSGRASSGKITGTMNGGGPRIVARTGDGTISLRAP